MSEEFLLVDYENIQKVDLSSVPDNMLVRIFLGQNQKNIPVEMAQQAQPRGQKIEYIQIEGQGKNALDFHIAFYMGKLQIEYQSASFIILSKDKGFDPLIAHINKLPGNCRRINSLFKLPGVIDNYCKDLNLKITIKKLLKNETNRPRKRHTLKKHISNIFKKKLEDLEMDNLEIDRIFNSLFTEGFVSESGGKLSYNF